ncbi:MAG TPA: hypothetical protein VJA21_05330 [Verrucomicrobiae bacterium]
MRRKALMSWHKQLLLVMAAFGLPGWSASSQAFLNEILFAPPGPDSPNQYIEIRGTPNHILPAGTYLLAVAGDLAADPGTIENVFDLSGRAIGGNGFLALLEKTNNYSPNPAASALVNTGSGPGFGSGSTSSIGHRGRSGRTDLPHASVTFFLIQTTNAPDPGADIDGNDDGTPGGQLYRSWAILDSVGVVKDAGDIGYGAINFRQNGAGIASGVVVPVSFTPTYLGRTGNTTNSEVGSWVAGGGLEGSAPDWLLSTNRTLPSEFSGLPLNHIGSPNFGAPPLPGIIVLESGHLTELLEGGVPASYLLGLTTTPAGPVTVRISVEGQIQVSANAGATFSNSCAVVLTNDALHEIIARAPLDNVIDAFPRLATIGHSVLATADPMQYPLAMLGPELRVNIFESESVLLNELKVNPPGTNDAPCEFIELKGPADALLTNVYLLVVDGDRARNPGEVRLAVNLTGYPLGRSGLLVITPPDSPYVIPTNTTTLADPRLSVAGGAIKNSAGSALLVSSPLPISEWMDLDAGNNGILEGLPPGALVLDAVGWTDGASHDLIYGGAILDGAGKPPDAMGRFPTDTTPRTADAWYFGELAGSECSSLVFDSTLLSSNFLGGTVLSPGAANNLSVQINSPGPLSGVIGDPSNPGVMLHVSADGAGPGDIVVTASSSNPSVVPDRNLVVVIGVDGEPTLYVSPVGIGYASITVSATSTNGTGRIAFPYAASAMGRPSGRWHTGTSDGSTAIALDADYMLVGDNENNILRLYDRNRSGAPIREFDFQSDLGLTPEEHGEVNIEASTRQGNRLYFIGAHSNANSAQSRTNRNRLFAADLSGTGTNTVLTFVGRYDYLKTDLIQWDSTNDHGKGTNYYGFAASAADNVNPKAPDGFNIEGLSMAPDSTNTAWIGFRAPIVPATNRTYALIVPVLNFAELAAGGYPAGSAVFGDPIELDLYGRGFRSFEGTTNGYLICGGSPGDTGTYPNDFRLYTWTGNPADQPQQRTTDLSGTQPEGIAELPPTPWTTNTQVQLISDNGTMVLYNDGIQNKHLPIAAFKKFRSDWVTLGPAVKPVPVIIYAASTSHSVSITWRALQGEAYRVQFTSRPSEPAWSDASGDIVATGPYATAVLPRPVQAEAFYRVQLLNP